MEFLRALRVLGVKSSLPYALVTGHYLYPLNCPFVPEIAVTVLQLKRVHGFAEGRLYRAAEPVGLPLCSPCECGSGPNCRCGPSWLVACPVSPQAAVSASHLVVCAGAAGKPDPT